MIRVANLVKYHGEHRILDQVSLEVRKGEVTALVGPSGGGKSTLLRCINGLEQFQEGAVSVEDVTLAGGRPHPTSELLQLRRRVGMVFQQFNLFPHMTALGNVLSGPLYSLGESREQAEPRAKALLERVGMGHRAKHLPSQLSGGQQQRVAVARALVGSPSILLADEPTGNLDSKNGEAVMELLRELHRAGATICMVTHDPRYAAHADRAIHLFDGRVVEDNVAALA